MPTHTETKFSPYVPDQLFDLVSDIERYPEFLPWCRAARILTRGEEVCEAELIIKFKHLTESYVSKVVMEYPHKIEATLVRGPFTHLTNRWNFIPENGGTRIEFFLDFAFRSRILDAMIGALFSRASAKMVAAFQARADHLYKDLLTDS